MADTDPAEQALRADAAAFADETASFDDTALYHAILERLGIDPGDNHTYASDRLTPGVWPKKIDIRGHFQIVGTNKRAITIGDLGGVIDFGGINVDDPAVLDEAAARLRVLADRLRQRQASRG